MPSVHLYKFHYPLLGSCLQVCFEPADFDFLELPTAVLRGDHGVSGSDFLPHALLDRGVPAALQGPRIT